MNENDNSAPICECDDETVKYVLTEWGCLAAVLKDYGVDVSHINGRVGRHIVDDFMELMCKIGYTKSKEDDENE